jgi:hypothetical protein
VLWTGTLLVSALTSPQATAVATDADADPAVLVYLAANLLAVLVQVATFVVVVILLNTARRNAVAVDPNSQARSAVWVWLSWFVPVVQLWFPFQVVRDIHRTTSRAARGTDGPAGLLGSWWLTWLLLVMALQVNNQVVLRDVTGSALVVSEWAVAILALLALPFWIRVVRDLAAVQDNLADRPHTDAETLLPVAAPVDGPYPYGVPPTGSAAPNPYGAPPAGRHQSTPAPFAAPVPPGTPNPYPPQATPAPSRAPGNPFAAPSPNPGGEPSSPWGP